MLPALSPGFRKIDLSQTSPVNEKLSRSDLSTRFPEETNEKRQMRSSEGDLVSLWNDVRN